MNTPIFDNLKAMQEAQRVVARIEARNDLIKHLKSIPKPTKQILETIKRLENARD